MLSKREIKPYTQYVVMRGVFSDSFELRPPCVVLTGHSVPFRVRAVDVYAADAVTGDMVMGIVMRDDFGIEVDDVE